MKLNIRSSYDSFRALRENQGYYMDKTEMLRSYLEDYADRAVLFARPRRFGKTLTMTMFRDFLDIRQKSEDIFAGLRIVEYPDVVKDYMNQYPVIFLSLKEVFGRDFHSIYESFRLTVSETCKQFKELLESDRVDPDDLELLRLLRRQTADEVNTVAFLSLLSRMLRDHYQRPVYVLVDECDVPMGKAYGTPDYDLVRDMVEHMLSYVCKTNDSVKAVILSGCLYTVKNSAYTGVNNIVPYNVLSPNFADSIGFTDADVRKLLEDAELISWYDVIEEWYNGYIFGRESMYCPWDVLLFVRSVMDGTYSKLAGPKSYWVNTSETSLKLIQGFMGRTAGANESMELLLAGKEIECEVNENVPYHLIHETGDNLWSALLETGYLTKAVREEMPKMPLRIPNREIQDVFRNEVWIYFKNRVDNVFVRDLVNALWAGEKEKAQAALNQILEATLSFYQEYHEYSYHLILDGFFTGMGYRVLSEVETGYGRSDLIILDPGRQRALILELKHVKEKEEMDGALRGAVSQLIQKKYASRLIYDGYTDRKQYGMAFCGKKVIIGGYSL